MSMNKFYSVSFDEINKEFSVRTFADNDLYWAVGFYKPDKGTYAGAGDKAEWMFDDSWGPVIGNRKKCKEAVDYYKNTNKRDPRDKSKYTARIIKINDKSDVEDPKFCDQHVGKILDSLNKRKK